MKFGGPAGYGTHCTVGPVTKGPPFCSSENVCFSILAGMRSCIAASAFSACLPAPPHELDVYLHKPAIAHIRRFLDNDVYHAQLHETPTHCRQCVQKAGHFMNLAAFAKEGGNGLLGLANSLREQCEELVRRGGERVCLRLLVEMQ